MDKNERLTVGTVLAVILLLVPSFVFHFSPRFAGSLAGFALGATAAVLMVLLLVYPLIKYCALLRTQVTKILPLRALLTFHVYAGVFGAFFGVLHTGHKLQSPLGIALVFTMLVAVVTGFIGRYYLPLTSAELRDAQSRLATLRSSYNQAAATLLRREGSDDLSVQTSMSSVQGVPIPQLTGSIADIEYSIGSREAIKHLFLLWIVAHVLAAILMYLLLILHVFGEFYYGLRWLS